MCSSPELLAQEMDHLGKVLHYNNYPKWIIDQQGRSNSPRVPIADPETGNEVKKSLFQLLIFQQSLQETLQIHTHTGLL